LTTASPYLGQILAAATAVAWALAVILFKKSGETVHPVALNLFKDTLAAALLLPTLWLFGETLFRRVPAGEYLLLMASGALGIGISDTLFFMALNRLGAGLIAIVDCLYSPFVITLSVIFLSERMSAWQLVGAGMIIGAVLLVGVEKPKAGLTRRDLLLGISFGVLALAGTAVGIVIIKRLLERSPLLWVTEIRLMSSIVVLLIVLLLHPARRTISRSLLLAGGRAYTLSGSFVGGYLSMVAWLGGMKYTQASIAAALNQMSNIFVFIFAALLLREPVNSQRTIAILLAVCGALLVTLY
jgi:drug/metabolite transporter (DMT)-like permease